jgi:hypothetical protein
MMKKMFAAVLCFVAVSGLVFGEDGAGELSEPAESAAGEALSPGGESGGGQSFDEGQSFSGGQSFVEGQSSAGEKPAETVWQPVETIWQPFSFQLAEGWNDFGNPEGFDYSFDDPEKGGRRLWVNGSPIPRVTNNILFGLIGGRGYNLYGFGLGGLWLINAGAVRGIQLSGAANLAAGPLDGFQIGGLGNVAGGPVKGFQIAGLGNVAGGTINGIQISALGNVAGQSANGFQITGLGNVAGESVYGFRAAGLANIAGGGTGGIVAAGLANIAGESVYGFQAAGIANVAGKSVYGLQAAGIANVAGESVYGFQAAGIANVAGKSLYGLQVSGIANVTGKALYGLQIGGLANVALGPAYGIQIAGIGNAAGEFRGLQAGLYNRLLDDKGGAFQIGLVNISKTERVVPLGLVNVVKNGLIHPAVYFDDTGFMNVSFRSGSKYVYSVVSVGSGLFGPEEYGDMFISRLGLGLELPLGPLFFDFDVSAGSISTFSSFGKTGTEDHDGSSSLDLQARLTAGYKIFEHLGVFAGISYDWVYMPGSHSPAPASPLLDLIPGELNGWSRQRLGFFAGLQF